MTATARIPEDARYADEEAFKSLVVSLLDRIATALETLAAREPHVRVTNSFGPSPTQAADDYAAGYVDEPAPIPGTFPQPFPMGAIAPTSYSTTQTTTTPYPQFPAPVAGWACPEHHQVKTVPAGISKAGKAYPEFLACPTSRCDHVARRCRVAGCTDASRA